MFKKLAIAAAVGLICAGAIFKSKGLPPPLLAIQQVGDTEFDFGYQYPAGESTVEIRGDTLVVIHRWNTSNPPVDVRADVYIRDAIVFEYQVDIETPARDVVGHVTAVSKFTGDFPAGFLIITKFDAPNGVIYFNNETIRDTSPVAHNIVTSEVTVISHDKVAWPCGSAANENGVNSVMCTLIGGTLTVSGVAGGGAMADYSDLLCNDDCDIATQDCQLPLCAGQPSVPPWYLHRGGITAVIIDSGVTHVGKHAFWDLPELATVTIGKDVTTIGRRAFAQSGKLSTVHIGGGVEYIGEEAFGGCGELKLVYSYNPVPPHIYPDVDCVPCPPEDDCPPCPAGSFIGVYDAVLYVPSAGLTAYTTSGSWEYHFPDIRPPMPTSVRPRPGVAQSRPAARPLVSVRGRTLSVSSPNNSALSIRMIDMRGRTAARFAGAVVPGRPLSFSLTKIPAGRYFVEIRDGFGRRDRSSVVVGGR